LYYIWSNENDWFILDVRSEEAYTSVHIEGRNTNIPLDQITDRLAEIPQGKPIIVLSDNEADAMEAAQLLADAGYGSVQGNYSNIYYTGEFAH